MHCCTVGQWTVAFESTHMIRKSVEGQLMFAQLFIVKNMYVRKHGCASLYIHMHPTEAVFIASSFVWFLVFILGHRVLTDPWTGSGCILPMSG